jgi:hypothetical protein
MGQAQDVLSQIHLDGQENFSEETIEKFKSDPEFYRTFVKEIEALVNNNFPIVGYPSASYRARSDPVIVGPHKQPGAGICTSQGHRVHDRNAGWR